jgi:membrane protein implicated in regulation of membrane protease activity
MGFGCVANAIRCGRVHCYVTGPFFFLMAAAALVYGFGALALGKHGWNLLGAVALVGALVLIYLPERLFGTYRRAQSAGSNFK